MVGTESKAGAGTRSGDLKRDRLRRGAIRRRPKPRPSVPHRSRPFSTHVEATSQLASHISTIGANSGCRINSRLTNGNPRSSSPRHPMIVILPSGQHVGRHRLSLTNCSPTEQRAQPISYRHIMSCFAASTDVVPEFAERWLSKAPAWKAKEVALKVSPNCDVSVRAQASAVEACNRESSIKTRERSSQAVIQNQHPIRFGDPWIAIDRGRPRPEVVAEIRRRMTHLSGRSSTQLSGSAPQRC